MAIKIILFALQNAMQDVFLGLQLSINDLRIRVAEAQVGAGINVDDNRALAIELKAQTKGINFAFAFRDQLEAD